MTIENTAAQTHPVEQGDILFVGLDLGTSQSAVATSSGLRVNTASVIGWPKDLVSYKLHQKTILFGDECLRNRMSVDIYYPLERGVIAELVKGKKGEEDQRKLQAPTEFIRHVLSLAEPKEHQQVYLVAGSPAEATIQDKQAVIDATSGLVNAVLVVSQPFLVAYGLGMYGFSLVVDIGAGTTDICRMHGTLPDEIDQKTLFKAGTFIDSLLFDLVQAKYPNANLTKQMAVQFKEKYAFVGQMSEQVSVELIVDGKPARCDITKEMKEACESILPDIIATVRSLITSFDPDFQTDLRMNIVLAGCVSRMRGLPQVIEQGLADLGQVSVKVVPDPVFAGAIGALKLAQDMPLSEWQHL